MKHLTLEQRYALKAYLECGITKTEVAIRLGVDRSTIHRELKRNRLKRGGYNPNFAQELAEERKGHFSTNRKFDTCMQKLVDKWIKEEQWSPEQIKGYCDDNGIEMVSHERIYQYIRQDKAKGGDLYKHLRHRLKHRKRPVSGKQEIIKNKVSFKVISLLNSESKGDTSWAIFWISSLVSAELRLKKILDIRSNCCPENSNASMVFLKEGLSGLAVIAPISDLASAMACSKAGLKCSFFILEKGAVSKGWSSGFWFCIVQFF